MKLPLPVDRKLRKATPVLAVYGSSLLTEAMASRRGIAVFLWPPLSPKVLPKALPQLTNCTPRTGFWSSGPNPNSFTRCQGPAPLSLRSVSVPSPAKLVSFLPRPRLCFLTSNHCLLSSPASSSSERMGDGGRDGHSSLQVPLAGYIKVWLYFRPPHSASIIKGPGPKSQAPRHPHPPGSPQPLWSSAVGPTAPAQGGGHCPGALARCPP